MALLRKLARTPAYAAKLLSLMPRKEAVCVASDYMSRTYGSL